MSRPLMLRVFKNIAFEVFGAYACRLALATHNEGRSPKALPNKVRFAYYTLKLMNFFIPLSALMRDQEKAEIERPQVYDEHLLNLMTNRAYDLPNVIVDAGEPRRINVLVPAFTISTISAGFFGVFNVALFIAEQGYRVRLVLFDNFYYREDEFRAALHRFPSMEQLFDRLEIEYIGSRTAPLRISPDDNCVATVWYSAYLADKISRETGGKPFVYLIQDFEAAFYPFNSLYCISRRSYDFHYHTLASSKSLLGFLKKNLIISNAAGLKNISFDNACSSSIYSEGQFAVEKARGKKRFVFYSRPAVNRNMFELAALALIDAFKQGVFGIDEWEFYGMGIGNTTIKISEDVEVEQLPRMPLKEYEEITKTFDLCLTLMSSPHPSLIPMDLASAGAIVVTNTFETKSSDYLTGISKNIIPASPNIAAISAAIQEGVVRVRDVTGRYVNAKINWPKSWGETWQDEHRNFIAEVFGNDR